MTTGYLWTGQFEEVKSVLEDGKPQSMELDENSLQGHWATNNKNNIEFFIINDAIFTKLCILGDDVEPCFEGASITKPEVSSTFSTSVDENFRKTLFSMIQDLQDALKGGNVMGQEDNNIPAEEFSQEEVNPSTPESALEPSESEPETSFEEVSSEEITIDEPSESPAAEEPVVEETPAEFAKDKEEDEEEKDSEEDSQEEESDESQDDDDEEKKKYSLLEQQYNELSAQYNELKQEYDSLVEFKLNVENEKKDALINEFYMLSDEDKKDVIEHKTEYSLDEIKAKLAVICYEKKVNFSLET